MSQSRQLLLFVDVDGVLVNHASLSKWTKEAESRKDFSRADYEESRYRMFDPICVARLNDLLIRPDTEYVISSTWRLHRDCVRVFKQAGVLRRALGKTPRLPYEKRGNEIQAWLDANPHDNRSIVILDDDSDMEHLTHRLVKTSMNGGLLDVHVEQALRLFNE